MKNRLTKYLSEFSNKKLTRPVSDKVRLMEIAAVAFTAISKFLFVDYLNWRLPFVLVTILGWSIYVWCRYKKDKLVLKDWGFRFDNFRSVLKFVSPFVIVSVISFFIIGYFQGTLNMTWHIIPLYHY